MNDLSEYALRQQVQELQREKLQLLQDCGHHSVSEVEKDAALLITARLSAWIDRLVAAGASEALGGFRDHSTAAALRESLEKLRHLTEQMMAREHQVVLPLRTKCASLEEENEQLKHKIIVLEASESTRDAQNFMEVEQSREAVAAYRSQLAAMQKQSADAADSFNLVIETMNSQRQQLADSLAHCVSLECEVSRVKSLLSEKEVSFATAIEQEKSNTAILQNQLDLLQQQGQQLLANFGAQGEVLKRQLAELASENESLRAQLETAKTKASEVASHVRDHRAELLTAMDPGTLRSQVTHFWFDGHQEIEQLKRRILELEGAEKRLPGLLRDVVGMKRSRSSIVENIATLSSEVERLRAEEAAAKAKCAGLEAENTVFVSQLADLLSGHLSWDQIAACGAAIRRAAADAAAATTVVIDPLVVQKARAEALELKNEVLLLGRKKEKLQRIIAAREDCACSLNSIITLKAAGTDHLAVADHVLNCALVGDADTDEVWAKRRAALYTELESTSAALSTARSEIGSLKFQLEATLANVAQVNTARENTALEMRCLTERQQSEISTLSQANALLSTENEAIRATNAQNCSQMQRLHDHHLSLYAFSATQSAVITAMHDKMQALYAELRSALTRKDVTAFAENQLDEQIAAQLQHQLQCLQDAIEEDRALRANWEASTALQLAADVEKRDELLRDVQSAYASGLKDNSKALDGLVREVRAVVDAKLSEKRVLLEKEIIAAQSRNHHEDAVLRTLAQSLARNAPIASTLCPSVTARQIDSQSRVVEIVASLLGVASDISAERSPENCKTLTDDKTEIST
jgi:hypothetical protein